MAPGIVCVCTMSGLEFRSTLSTRREKIMKFGGNVPGRE